MIISKKMLCFSTELKAKKSNNGSSITPIKHGEDWLLPLGFMRELSNESIEFEEVTITEDVEDPK